MPADHLTGLRPEAAGAALAHNEDDLLARSGSEKAGLAFFGPLSGAGRACARKHLFPPRGGKRQSPVSHCEFLLKGRGMPRPALSVTAAENVRKPA